MLPWRGVWLPSPVFSPGESDGQRGLVGPLSTGSQSQARLSTAYTHSGLRVAWGWSVGSSVVLGAAQGSLLSSPDPERWTNIPLLVKILKLIINELSSVMEANAARQAAPAEWNQGALCPHTLPAHCSGAHLAGPRGAGFQGLPAARPPFPACFSRGPLSLFPPTSTVGSHSQTAGRVCSSRFSLGLGA